MFIVYGKEDCTYCVQAVELLKSKGEEFLYKKLDVDYSRDELFSTLDQFGVVPRSMPQITSEQGYVGGFTELRNLLA